MRCDFDLFNFNTWGKCGIRFFRKLGICFKVVAAISRRLLPQGSRQPFLLANQYAPSRIPRCYEIVSTYAVES